MGKPEVIPDRSIKVDGLGLGQFSFKDRRRTCNEAVGGDDLSLPDNGSGRNDRSGLYHGRVQDESADADERPAFDGAAVHDGVMADGHVITDPQGMVPLGMKRAVILYVGISSDPDKGGIAPDHCPVPDTGAFPDFNISDDGRRRSDENVRCDPRFLVFIRQYHRKCLNEKFKITANLQIRHVRFEIRSNRLLKTGIRSSRKARGHATGVAHGGTFEHWREPRNPAAGGIWRPPAQVFGSL